MALTIELPITVEQRLRQDAIQNGMSINAYLMQLITGKTSGKKAKKISEAELLKKINLDITEAEWENYNQLIHLRKNGSLTEKDHNVLIQLGEKIEIANVKRLEYIATLAQMRQTSLEETMTELGIFPLDI
jgi:hypothetical protein